MPELPEVEICARNLARWTAGARFRGAVVRDPRSLRGATPEELDQGIAGRHTAAIRRRGKRIAWWLSDGPALCLHLGMTGKWVRRRPGEPDPEYTRVTVFLGDGTRLHFRDPRLLGRLEVRDAAGGEAWLREGLGPDALTEAPDAAGLRARLRRTRRPVKAALMDQAVLAGLGNIHAAEVLWRAGIAPGRGTDTLSDEELGTLARTIPEVLAETVRAEEGDEIAYVEEAGAANPFRVYGRRGEPCPRCGTPILRDVHAGRGSYYCPKCQR